VSCVKSSAIGNVAGAGSDAREGPHVSRCAGGVCTTAFSVFARPRWSGMS
jgi:hypothetical protein